MNFLTFFLNHILFIKT